MIFSIGETSKLTKISIQALRHYDKEGLLKPIYVDEETKYRYYSIDQFLQIDFIKRCKSLGFSLEKIKEILYEGNNLENILKSITFQKSIIEKEIKNLKNIKLNLNRLENTLNHAMNSLNKALEIEDVEFFILGSSKGEIKDNNDIETHIRKVLKNIDLYYNLSDTFIILKTDEENYNFYQEVIVASKSIKSDKIYKRKGVSLYVEGAAFKNKVYFEKIINFENENKLTNFKSFLEIYYISKLDNKNEEYSLINIFHPFELM
ncbi:helix-turn-helix domain-containing protein [Cetobacterium somerae]|uniref:MerR family transcriptional regulator n=1 Tax=Cetobacterium sp. NK01 TaxID=2993530 RepID=UPI002116493F|nr:helix-turn-helix domain-containing protein [Cetobacterium sp. NK01]MCQ8211188.1 helix-turn-helix domain-containing protein [Cetobacterium sp. NK01]